MQNQYTIISGWRGEDVLCNSKGLYLLWRKENHDSLVDYENRQANIMAVLSDPYNLQWGLGGGAKLPQSDIKYKMTILFEIFYGIFIRIQDVTLHVLIHMYALFIIIWHRCVNEISRMSVYAVAKLHCFSFIPTTSFFTNKYKINIPCSENFQTDFSRKFWKIHYHKSNVLSDVSEFNILLFCINILSYRSLLIQCSNKLFISCFSYNPIYITIKYFKNHLVIQ